MATIIDSLVITLGLNAQPMQTAQGQALASLRNFVQQLHTQSQAAQTQATGITSAFSRMKLGIAALGSLAIGAAAGFFELERKLTASDAALAHTARTLSMNAVALGNWQSTAQAAGGSAAGVTAAFAGLTSQMTHMQFTGVPFEGVAWLQALNVGLLDANGHMKDAAKIFVDLSKSARAHGYDLRKTGEVFSQVFGAEADSLLQIEDRARRAGMSVEQYQRHIEQLSGRTQESVDRHQRLSDLWNEMSVKAESLGRMIETTFGPTFEHIEQAIGGLITKVEGFFFIVKQSGWEAAWHLVFPSWVIETAKTLRDYFNSFGDALDKAEAAVKGTVGGWWDKLFGSTSAHGNVPPGGGVNQQNPTGLPTGRGGASPASAAMAKGAMIDQLRKEGVPEANLDAAASLLLGQAMAESNLNPRTVHDFNTGYGIYGARLDRRDAMLKWLKDNGFAPDSLEGQSRFMAHEPFHSKRFAPTAAALMSATRENIGQLEPVVMRNFENPAGNQSRMNQTMRALMTGVQQAPQVDAGASGASQSWPSSIDNSQRNSSISNSNHVAIQNLNVTTPDPDDFSRRLQPVMEGNAVVIPADGGAY